MGIHPQPAPMPGPQVGDRAGKTPAPPVTDCQAVPLPTSGTQGWRGHKDCTEGGAHLKGGGWLLCQAQLLGSALRPRKGLV